MAQWSSDQRTWNSSSWTRLRIPARATVPLGSNLGQVVYTHCLPSFSAPRNWGTKREFSALWPTFHISFHLAKLLDMDEIFCAIVCVSKKFGIFVFVFVFIDWLSVTNRCVCCCVTLSIHGCIITNVFYLTLAVVLLLSYCRGVFFQGYRCKSKIKFLLFLHLYFASLFAQHLIYVVATTSDSTL